MAIRYSGDVEVRIHSLGKDRYDVRVRAPNEHLKMHIHRPFVWTKEGSSEAYDVVARESLRLALDDVDLPLEFDDRGAIVVRRVFQAPCPYGNWD